MMPPLRAISLVGNLLALTVIATLCAQDMPLTSVAHDASTRAGVDATSRPNDTLLIVIDALRLDVASDAETMPTLVALARDGDRRVLRVTQPVPSTVGALPALVEGRAVASSAALFDLTPRAAASGGLLTTLHRLGVPAEVGGTALWTGLYGRWLGEGRSVDGMPGADSDASIVRWALARLDQPSSPPLLIVHLGALDATAHRHGVGPRYRATARRIDRDVGRLEEAARRAGRSVLVTSDHGVTRQGGHAGGENVVRRVPLIAVDAPLRVADGAPQRAIAAELADRLGLPSPTVVDVPLAEPVSLLARLLGLALSAIASLAAWRAIGRLGALGRGRAAATSLAVAPWIAVGVAVTLTPPVGAAIATLALAVAAWHGLRTRRDPVVAMGRLEHGRGIGPFAIGVVLGLASLGAAALELPSAVASATALAGLPIALGIATVLVVLLARRLVDAMASSTPPASRAGLVAVTGLVIAYQLAGDGISLSNLDVALAHRAADGPGGTLAAVVVAIARLWWLPAVFATACVVLALRRQGADVRPASLAMPAPRSDVLEAVQWAARTTVAMLAVHGIVLQWAWPDAPIVFGIALGGTLHALSIWMGVLLVATVACAVVRHGSSTVPAVATGVHR